MVKSKLLLRKKDFLLKEYLRKIAQYHRNKLLREGATYNLCCYCAIASYRLFEALKRKKLDPIFVCVEESLEEAHCFVLCGDYMVDITASQFGEKDIIVEKPKARRTSRRWYWRINSTKSVKVCKFKNKKDIREHLKEWPPEQNPTRNKSIY